MKPEIKILKIARHRNGVMGCPFYVVLFKDKEWQHTFVANIFDAEELCVSVLAIDELVKENIAFGEGNSWRGDYYEKVLWEAIEEYEKERK